MATPEFDDRELEQMGAVADYCRAAETLQRAEFRCAALGVHPRSERVQFFALMEKAERRTETPLIEGEVEGGDDL